MQINTSKNILLIMFLLSPVFLFSQKGMKKYVTRSGDTTIVVMGVNSGLQSEDVDFLYDSKLSDDFEKKRTRYTNLKQAVTETDQVAEVVDVEKQATNPNTGSLGFRIAQKNIRYLQNEKQAQRAVHEILNRDASVEELTYLLEKFGNKPSYFINGIHVEPKVAAGISENDILSRSIKVSNTTTGNPNGEVWYVVPSKIFDQLALRSPELFERNMAEQNYDHNIDNLPLFNEGAQYRPIEKELVEQPSNIITPLEVKEEDDDRFWADPVVSQPQLKDTQANQKLSDQQRELDELRRAILSFGQEPVVSSEVGRTANKVSNGYETSSAGKAAPAIQQSQDSYSPNTKQPFEAVNHKPNNRSANREEVVSFRDSPQEKARRARDREANIFEDTQVSPVDEDVIQITNQAKDSSITKDTPKRSIRKIKDRERNR